MSGWSLGISGASLLVSILAASYAGRINAREGRRRHAEITPTLIASLEELGAHHSKLWLALGPGQVDLDALDVEIIHDSNDHDPVVFTPSQDGVDPAAKPPRLCASWARLARGERAVWRVELPPYPAVRGDELRLRVISHARRHEAWTTLASTPVPPDVRSTVP